MSRPAVLPDVAAVGVPPPRAVRPGIPLALAAVGIAAQIAYPLLSGGRLRAATVAAVVLLAAAAIASAARAWSLRGAVVLLAVGGGIGLLAEAVGLATGLPFGAYTYGYGLGPRVLGVPLLVPLAWIMMSYPCLLLARTLAGRPVGMPTGHAGEWGRRLRTAVLGGLALTAWDLFLDPQMVAEGHWTWLHPDPGLPGVSGVPLTNYAGWLLVGTGMTAALDAALPRTPADPWVPAAILTWTWVGSVVGNLAFFDRPAVAFYGGVAMGAIVLPYLVALRRRRARPTPEPS